MEAQMGLEGGGGGIQWIEAWSENGRERCVGKGQHRKSIALLMGALGSTRRLG